MDGEKLGKLGKWEKGGGGGGGGNEGAGEAAFNVRSVVQHTMIYLAHTQQERVS